MLLMIARMGDVNFGQLMSVYEESNRRSGMQLYPHHTEAAQLLMVEQDVYSYLNSVFKEHHAKLAVWAPLGRYMAALRLEEYRDGVLISGLETAPEQRRKGYAKSLLQNVIQVAGHNIIYAHIAKSNLASIALHELCGFQRIKDHAIFLDGSVSADTYTYALNK